MSSTGTQSTVVAMRGFFLGLLVLPLVAITVLSIRPGGLRRQLANAGRRLRLVLVLAGVYLVASGLVRYLAAGTPFEDWGLPVLALGLAIAFIVLAQDPPPERSG